RAYSRLLLRIVPQPQCGFVLDANPMDARARKPEYPLEFLVANRLSYLNLSNLVGGITVIPPMDVRSVERFIMDHILQSPSRDGSQGLSGGTTPMGAESLSL
ncbi:MAG: hypothetical protein WBY75_06810, partial [Terracidiphilus sp.]